VVVRPAVGGARSPSCRGARNLGSRFHRDRVQGRGLSPTVRLRSPQNPRTHPWSLAQGASSFNVDACSSWTFNVGCFGSGGDDVNGFREGWFRLHARSLRSCTTPYPPKSRVTPPASLGLVPTSLYAPVKSLLTFVILLGSFANELGDVHHVWVLRVQCDDMCC